MLRKIAIGVAKQSWIRKILISTPILRDVAWRFVAGEDLAAGVKAVRALNGRGISGTLNLVGTHLRSEVDVVASADATIESLRRIALDGIDANVSIKLTTLGLDIDDDLCRAQLGRIMDVAAEVGVFVRIDMEESPYVDTTINLFEEMRDRYGAEAVGIVIQSYVRAREADLDRLIPAGSRIRLVKGGYWEPPEIVYRRQADLDAAFIRDIDRLLRGATHPAIATHDAEAIRHVKALSAELGLDKSSFEFQMLYGVRPDLADALVREGYSVRSYVPYGGQWYAYVLGCLRRLPGGALRRLTGRFRGRRSSV